MSVRRAYVVCGSCRENAYPADGRLGIVGRLSVRARKWSCLFGSGWGFAKAAEHLADVCGWAISAQSVERACVAEAPAIEAWRQAAEATADFAAAAQAGEEVEFLTDGTTVNTVEGRWKEIRLAAFVARPAGEPARVHQWDARKLPEPVGRSVRVAMATAEDFASGWRDWAVALGIVATAAITVLADGAKWIWSHARAQFPDAGGVLDVFHALEHLAAATKAVYGEGSGSAIGWRDVGRRALLGDGWSGVCEWVGRWRQLCDPEHRAKVESATGALLNYLADHTQHLGYCERLARGRSIGSGLIEGSCKYVIGRRLKRNGGRWRQANAVRMGTLCSTHYVGDWRDYWDAGLSLSA